MNQDLTLKILSHVMLWSDERARNEFRWLRLMARLKYDGYRDFQAGMRFVESLAVWLQQFAPGERETAYAFVRKTLAYVGPGELQRLVEQFYPRVVRKRLVAMAAAQHGIAPYQVLANATAHAAADDLLKRTLFMGLSDGARIDILRHANVGILNNEQVVVATQVDKRKWRDLLEKLREETNDAKAQFRLAYLIDDFAGTGTSCLRFNAEKQKWSGKLMRFKESLEGAGEGADAVFAPDWELCVHHYIASASAAQALSGRLKEAQSVLQAEASWARAIHPSFGTVFAADFPVDATAGLHDDFIVLTNKYYDPILRTKHTDVGGVEHLGLGYGGCALPLVLDHNTPNNSVALIWAETEGGDRNGKMGAAMRPLFRRRQRHVG